MPELDERTQFWMQAFSVLHRTRSPSMGSVSPINPIDVLDLAERLHWPCEPEEALHVISRMDDQWREMNQPAEK